ncbi:Outer membrane TonB-dependent transducer VreA of trans-envelope signaling system [plant metagenome]|uniref:Outer membrane TonB-dependent transducer VreA of trans-envelope signaling system n=1 Tax=plant metagenome TaxID=1297885 RepID=A0A484UYZ2_9ZZZZ
MLAIWAGVVSAAEPPPAGQLLDFDIPAQPLGEALNRYGETARLAALYPSRLATGLWSAPVHGRYTREDALRLLLQGTGLALAKASTPDGDVFRLARAPAAAPASAGLASGIAPGGYLPLLQAAVMHALCQDPRTAPGHYRTLFEVAIDESGRAASAELLSSSGDAGRDAALLAALRQTRAAVPPAASRHVPYLFTLRPAAAGAAAPCRAVAGGAP